MWEEIDSERILVGIRLCGHDDYLFLPLGVQANLTGNLYVSKIFIDNLKK